MIHNISALDPNKLYTYADYLTWQVRERIELIKGRLFKMAPAPLRYHQELSSALHGEFRRGKYRVDKMYTREDTVKIGIFEDFSIDLSEVFEEEYVDE